MNLLVTVVTGSPCFLYLVVFAPPGMESPAKSRPNARCARQDDTWRGAVYPAVSPAARPRRVNGAPPPVDYWRARRAATRIQGQKLCPLACAAAASVMKGPVSVERPRAACGGDIGNGAAPEHACVRRERNGQDRRIHGEAGDPNSAEAEKLLPGFQPFLRGGAYSR
jgi:hypothetical protein